MLRGRGVHGRFIPIKMEGGRRPYDVGTDSDDYDDVNLNPPRRRVRKRKSKKPPVENYLKKVKFNTKAGPEAKFIAYKYGKTHKGRTTGRKRVKFRTANGEEVDFVKKIRKRSALRMNSAAPRRRRRRTQRGRGAMTDTAIKELMPLATAFGKAGISEAGELGRSAIVGIKNKLFKRMGKNKNKITGKKGAANIIDTSSDKVDRRNIIY